MFIVSVNKDFKFYNELFNYIMEEFDKIIYIISTTTKKIKHRDRIITILYSEDVKSKILARIFCNRLQQSKFAYYVDDISPSYIKKDRFVMYVSIPEEKYGFL